VYQNALNRDEEKPSWQKSVKKRSGGGSSQVETEGQVRAFTSTKTGDLEVVTEASTISRGDKWKKTGPTCVSPLYKKKRKGISQDRTINVKKPLGTIINHKTEANQIRKEGTATEKRRREETRQLTGAKATRMNQPVESGGPVKETRVNSSHDG